MPDDFLIAHNPEDGSRLPYLLRIPLGPDGIVLKAKETWPRTGKVYCHRATGWPAEPDLSRSCPPDPASGAAPASTSSSTGERSSARSSS
ncbi:hypothetical protein [Serinicoccus marinus]|uniref:hypothetical protein n=1 Tax=Serinicoccus marinus TaxID=247333 RepID=UPI001EE88DFE|nr:hypothetical protein [Serinicoccus marinus]